MQIFFLIGVPMVMPMMRRPPERTLLHCGAADPCQDELKPAARAVRAVGKVTMVSSRDSEHADHVERKTHHERLPARARPKCGERGGVHANKRQALCPVNGIAFVYRIVTYCLDEPIHSLSPEDFTDVVHFD